MANGRGPPIRATLWHALRKAPAHPHGVPPQGRTNTGDGERRSCRLQPRSSPPWPAPHCGGRGAATVTSVSTNRSSVFLPPGALLFSQAYITHYFRTPARMWPYPSARQSQGSRAARLEPQIIFHAALRATSFYFFRSANIRAVSLARGRGVRSRSERPRSDAFVSTTPFAPFGLVHTGGKRGGPYPSPLLLT